MRDSSALKRAALIATSVAFWFLIVREFLESRGVPALQQDWLWPATRSQCLPFSLFGASPWLWNGTGTPAAYPQPWLPYLISGAPCSSFGPHTALLLFLAVVVLTGSTCVVLLLNALGTRALGAQVLGLALFWGNPVILNELQAGHLFFLWSYAFLPLVCIVTMRRSHFWSAIACGTAVFLASAQQQFFFFAIAALAIVVASAPRRGDALFVLVSILSACAEVSTQAFALVVPAALNGFYPLHPQVHWEASQSASLADALRGLGYIGGYDQKLLGAPSRLMLFAIPIAAVPAALWGSRFNRIVAFGAVVCILFIWGENGPGAATLNWMFIHIRAFALFRELYNFSGPLALALVLLVTSSAQRVIQHPRFAAGAVAVVAALASNAVYIAAQASTGIPQFAFDANEMRAIERLEHTSAPSRFILVPAILPQSFVANDLQNGMSPWLIPFGMHRLPLCRRRHFRLSRPPLWQAQATQTARPSVSCIASAYQRS